MTAPLMRVAAATAAFAAAFALVSCGTATKKDSAAESTTVISAGPVAGHDTDDVMYAQMMIPHHQQAVELAALVPERSTNPALIALAKTIAGQQQPEVDAMKAMLVQWEVDPNEMLHDGGHGMTMAGMVDDATIVRLEALKGTEFDTLWLKSMISHHQGAIEMAKVEIKDGSNVDMIGLAKSIVTTQQAEIDQMNQLLAASGG